MGMAGKWNDEMKIAYKRINELRGELEFAMIKLEKVDYILRITEELCRRNYRFCKIIKEKSYGI